MDFGAEAVDHVAVFEPMDDRCVRKHIFQFLLDHWGTFGFVHFLAVVFAVETKSEDGVLCLLPRFPFRESFPRIF